MGLLDMVEGAVSSGGAGETAKVAGGLMQALEEHPGGLSGLISTMQSNGVEPSQVSSPEQVQQGLNGTGLIENVAARAGVSPAVAQMAMTTVLPMVVAHFTNNGQQAPPQGGYSAMASEVLSKLL